MLENFVTTVVEVIILMLSILGVVFIIKTAIGRRIRKNKPENGWISANNPPKTEERVLLLFGDEEATQCVGWYAVNHGVYECYDSMEPPIGEVVAWQELPKSCKM